MTAWLCTTGSNGFQVNHDKKSFLLYAPSVQDKASWLSSIKRFCTLSQEAAGVEPVEARAVWIPDKKVRVCMVCMEAKFTMTNRRHHCRNCGKVCCGACSNVKAVLNQDKPERVCTQCHSKLGGKAPSDVPVLGKASTETHRRG